MAEEPEYISNPIVDRWIRQPGEDAEGHVQKGPGVEKPSVRKPSEEPEDDSEGHISTGALGGENKKLD